MNKEQIAYAVAKAKLEALEEAVNEQEMAFILENAIENPDGSVPKHLWCMEDEDAFNVANTEFGRIMTESGLEADLNAARRLLHKAEDDLIAYGLSLAPERVRKTLEKSARTDWKTREKILELTFRLDPVTV